MAFTDNLPSIKPSLLLDFANSKALDPRITFTRASSATFYDGKTVAKAEENLLLNSQDYSATWTVTDLTPVTGKTAPNATATATEFEADDANGTLTQAVTAVAGDYTFSVFLRRVTGTGDVQISSHSGGTWVTQSITGTWARYTVTQTLTAGSRTPGVRVVTSGDVIEVWGAQMEQRSAATAYTPTTTQIIRNYVPVLQTAAAGVGRFDHNPVTGESLGLLIEEQRTNLLLRSKEFDTGWTVEQLTVSPNVAVAPDGALTGDKLVENTATSVRSIRQSITGLASGSTLTFSVYLKAAERTTATLYINDNTTLSNRVQAIFDLSAGTTSAPANVGNFTGATSTITNVGNGWYRCTLSGVATGVTAVQSRVFIGITTYTGDGRSGIYIWGAQLEAAAFPTSYIPTTSATVTRAADAAVMTGTNFSDWYRADEGALYVEIRPASLAATSGVVINDNTTDDRIRLATTSATDQGTVTVGGSGQAELDGGTPVAGASMKLAMAYKVDDFALSLDGGSVATDTSGTVPVVTQLQLGAETTSIGTLTIKKFSYYPFRLQNATLQAMTS